MRSRVLWGVCGYLIVACELLEKVAADSRIGEGRVDAGRKFSKLDVDGLDWALMDIEWMFGFPFVMAG